MTVISAPRHIVWSTDRLDLADPFQRNLKVDLAQDSPFQLEPPARTEAGIRVSSLVGAPVDGAGDVRQA